MPVANGPARRVPFVVKDLKAKIAGMANTSGSRLCVENIAASDSEWCAGTDAPAWWWWG